jgi:hypothetical protein
MTSSAMTGLKAFSFGARGAFLSALLDTADGFDIDVQLPRNLFVTMAFGQQCQNLLVALGTFSGPPSRRPLPAPSISELFIAPTLLALQRRRT